MSADNGIYIAEFPTADGGKEYRVVEAMAIDNCDLQWMPPGPQRTKMEDAYRCSYFGRSMAHRTTEAAETEADEIYAAMGSSPLLEYGICHLKFNRPLVKMSAKEMQDILGF